MCDHDIADSRPVFRENVAIFICDICGADVTLNVEEKAREYMAKISKASKDLDGGAQYLLKKTRWYNKP